MKIVHKFVLSALFALSLPVLAMDLQQAMSALGPAKAQGLVGEQPNGYLGVVATSAQAKEIASRKIFSLLRSRVWKRFD